MYIGRDHGVDDPQHPLRRLADLQGLYRRPRLFAGQGGDLPDDLFGLFRRAVNLLGAVVDVVRGVGLGQNHAGIPHNGGQQVVELVGDAPGERAHQLKALVVGHLFLPAAQLLQLAVEFPQIFILLLRPGPGNGGDSQFIENHHKGGHECNGEQRDADHSLADGRRDLVVVDNRADDDEIVLEPNRRVSRDLFHPLGNLVGPPVGMVDFRRLPALLLVLDQGFQLA